MESGEQPNINRTAITLRTAKVKPEQTHKKDHRKRLFSGDSCPEVALGPVPPVHVTFLFRPIKAAVTDTFQAQLSGTLPANSAVSGGGFEGGTPYLSASVYRIASHTVCPLRTSFETFDYQNCGQTIVSNTRTYASDASAPGKHLVLSRFVRFCFYSYWRKHSKQLKQKFDVI